MVLLCWCGFNSTLNQNTGGRMLKNQRLGKETTALLFKNTFSCTNRIRSLYWITHLLPQVQQIKEEIEKSLSALLFYDNTNSYDVDVTETGSITSEESICEWSSFCTLRSSHFAIKPFHPLSSLYHNGFLLWVFQTIPISSILQLLTYFLLNWHSGKVFTGLPKSTTSFPPSLFKASGPGKVSAHGCTVITC